MQRVHSRYYDHYDPSISSSRMENTNRKEDTKRREDTLHQVVSSMQKEIAKIKTQVQSNTSLIIQQEAGRQEGKTARKDTEQEWLEKEVQEKGAQIQQQQHTIMQEEQKLALPKDKAYAEIRQLKASNTNYKAELRMLHEELRKEKASMTRAAREIRNLTDEIMIER